MRPLVHPDAPLMSDPRGRRFDRVAFTVVLAIALTTRAGFLWRLVPSVVFDADAENALSAFDVARRIAGGEWLAATETLAAGIVHPFFLALARVVSDSPALFAAMAQSALGAAGCLLVYSAARRAFGRPAALASGLLAALYPPGIAAACLFGSSTWASVLEAGAIAALLSSEGSRRDRLIASGALAGLACSARPTLFWVIPAILVWLAVDLWLRPVLESGRIREAAIRFLAFLAPAAATLSPLAWSAWYSEVGGRALPAILAGRSPGPAGPAPFGSLLVLLGGEEAWPNPNLGSHLSAAGLPDWLSTAGWIVLFPLSAAGIALTARAWRDLLPLYLFALGAALSAALCFDDPGARLPLAMAILPFAGEAIVEAPRALRGFHGERRRLAPSAVFLLALSSAVFLPPRAAFDSTVSSIEASMGAGPLLRRGQSLLEEGRAGEALPLLDEARASAPRALAPVLLHARALAETGSAEQGRAAVEAALDDRPALDAMELAEANYALGLIAREERDEPAMIFHFRETLAKNPRHRMADWIREITAPRAMEIERRNPRH